jgi:hypothetical protein
MSRRHGIWTVGLLAAALGPAAVGVHASLAAPTLPANTNDATYSCRVASQHVVNLYASVTLPPAKSKPQPGVLVVTTGVKTVTHGDTTTTVSQVGVEAVKNGLKIDKSSCRHVKKQIPLKSKGLPGPATVVTPTLRGFDSENCGTSARVLVRLKLQTANGTPSHALLAIRNQGGKSRPVAFYNWSPSKVTVFSANTCSTN